MTESRIFQILLKYNQNVNLACDYPKLQAEAVDIVAEKFTDILYQTNQKSTTNQVLRGKILQYLHTTCGVKKCHVDENNYGCFLKNLRESIHCNVADDVFKLTKEIDCELEKDVPLSLPDKMIAFYKRKNSKQKEKQQKLEYIGNRNQERLGLKLDMPVRRNFSYYEISENMIKDLIDTKSVETKTKTYKMDTKYRERQIKFCYALLNLKSDLDLLETILQGLVDYKRLEPFEVNFLLYLWGFEDEYLDFSLTVSEKFPLVLERIIIKKSAEILHLKEDIEVKKYFSDLEKDKKFMKIRKSCAQNVLLNKKLTSLIYELYCYSFCNKNILALINLIQ